MATANDLINAALKLIGELGQGETASANDSEDGRVALNDMLDSWATKRLYVYRVNKENFTLTVSKNPHTIGSGADFNTTRPNVIDDAYIQKDGIDYPLTIIQNDEYNAFSDKTVESNLPEYLYYDPAMATGNIYLYPVPSEANSLYIDSWNVLQSFSSLTDAVSLPPGYERAIKFNLAIELAPLFDSSVPDTVLKIANESKGNIKRRNAQHTKLLARIDPAITGIGGSRYNIYSDR